MCVGGKAVGIPLCPFMCEVECSLTELSMFSCLVQWIKPAAASDMLESGEVLFAPPQFAEIAHLDR